MMAAQLGHEDQVADLLVYTLGDLNLLASDETGMTALHHAVMRGHLSVVGLLLDEINKYNLSVDVADRAGKYFHTYAQIHLFIKFKCLISLLVLYIELKFNLQYDR